jgi:hypothetical protein
MADSVKKWQIYCIEESKWVEGWSVDKPIVCFNHNTHEINPNSQQILETTQLITVKIDQEEIPTGGHYCCEGFVFDCPPNVVTVYPVRWPIPITTSVVTIQALPENIGDIVNCIVNPKTLVGGTTSFVSAGSTRCSVNSTVIENAKVGYECFINNELLGRIINIFPLTFEVEFETPTTVNYNMGNPFFIQLRIIRNHQVTEFFQLGASNIGGKYVPQQFVTHVIYTNNSNVDKKFRFNIEYLF